MSKSSNISSQANEIPDFNGKRILLCEDNDLNIMVSKAFLLKTGAELEIAKNGIEAFNFFKNSENNNKPYDLIFMDIQMPEMDGYDTTVSIRKLDSDYSKNVKIIAMTGNVNKSEISRCISSGMNDYISKPVSAKILYEKAAFQIFGTVKYNTVSTSSDFPTPPTKPKSKTATKAPDFSGKRVLIVDDNKLNVEILHLMVKKTGAEIFKAENGKEALDKYLNSDLNFFDIILIDIQMPVMNGTECAVKIRNSGRQDSGLPIIAISANAFTEDIEKSLEAGINLHLSKPVNMKLLFETMEKII